MLIAALIGPVLRQPALRLLARTLLSAVTLLVLLWLFPHCRGGSYGDLDVDVANILFPDIGEAQPVWIWAASIRQQIALVVMPPAGLVAVLVVAALAPKDQRWRWLELAGIPLSLFAAFCLQVRGFRLVSIAVLPNPA